MVLQSELQGYDHDYFSNNNGYGHKEDHHYDNGGYFEDISRMQMGRPHITTPEPTTHYVVGYDQQSYGGGHSQDSRPFGKQHSLLDHGYSAAAGGGGMHHKGDYGSNMYGKTHHQGFYGQQSHGHPVKPPHGMHHQSSLADVEYENHHEYLHSRPGNYESMRSYGYFGEVEGGGGNHRPPPSYYGEQHRMQNKNWPSHKGGADQWMSKGL